MIMAKKVPYRIYLSEEEMPKVWYNIRADMKEQPAPLLNPATLKPVTAEDLAPVFCDELSSKNWTAQPSILKSPVKSWSFTGCTALRPLSAVTTWKRLWVPRRRSTTSLKGTTPPAVTS